MNKNIKTVDINSTWVVIVAVLLSAASVMVFNAQPVILGVASDQLGLSPGQLGMLATAEIGGIGIASVTAVFWIRRLSWRTAAMAGLCVMIAGNLLSALFDQFLPLALTRFFIGLLGEGVVFAVAIGVIGDTEDSDRAFAFTLAGQVGFGMVGLWGFPYLAQPWGYDGIVICLGAIALASLFLLRWVPLHGIKETVVAEASVESAPLLPVFLGLGAMFLWFTGLSGVWAFIERMGIESGLAQTQVGSILALGMALGMLGALLASWVGDRYGRFWQPVVSLVAHMGLSIVLATSDSPNPYIISVLSFTFIWNIGLPYLLGLIANADVSGRFVVLIIAAQAFGNALGPSIAGSVASAENLTMIGFTASGFCLLSLLIYSLFVVQVKRIHLVPSTV
ncbi:MAG: MFS transporter [Pseudomonadales bacterium]